MKGLKNEIIKRWRGVAGSTLVCQGRQHIRHGGKVKPRKGELKKKAKKEISEGKQ